MWCDNIARAAGQAVKLCFAEAMCFPGGATDDETTKVRLGVQRQQLVEALEVDVAVERRDQRQPDPIERSHDDFLTTCHG